MTLPRAFAVPAVLVVVLAVVGAWVDGSRSSSADSVPVTTTTVTGASVPPSSSPTVASVAPTSVAADAQHTSCTSVVHIGDSTSVGLTSPDHLPDPATRIDARYAAVGVTDFRPEISGARSTVERLQGQENAVEVAERLRAAGYQGCWVLALGTTDAANIAAGANTAAATRIDRLMSVIGSDPVLWVDVKTLRTDGPWQNSSMLAWNEALTAAAARYPNIKIYDWAAVVQDAWFGDDRIHYTTDGYTQRAALIADALGGRLPVGVAARPVSAGGRPRARGGRSCRRGSRSRSARRVGPRAPRRHGRERRRPRPAPGARRRNRPGTRS